MTAIDDAAVAGRLRDYLRERSGMPSVDYRSPPQRIPGGNEMDIFRLTLGSAPPEWTGPLILRRMRFDRSPWRAAYEAAIQNALADRDYPAPGVVVVETDN